MNWSVNRKQRWVLRLEASDAPGSAMRRTVVQDPEDAASLVVRRLIHNLRDEPIERFDPIFSFAASKQFGAVDIKGSDVSPCSTAFVLMFHLHGQTRFSGKSLVPTVSSLDAGFLIGRDDELVVLQRTTFPDSFVQIQDAPRFLREIRVAREDPAAVLPGPDRILIEPAPDRRATDCCHDASLTCLGSQVPRAPSRERNVMSRGEFTGQRLDLNDHLWGGKPGGDPGEDAPPSRRVSFPETVCARSRQLHGAYRDDERFHRFQAPERPSGLFWRVAPENTLTYISGLERSVRVPPPPTERSEMGFFSASCLPPLNKRMPRKSCYAQQKYVSVFKNRCTKSQRRWPAYSKAALTTADCSWRWTFRDPAAGLALSGRPT